MIVATIEEMETVLSREGPLEWLDLLKDMHLLRAKMKTVPTKVIVDEFDTLATKEQARIYASYKHLVAQAKTQEDLDCLRETVVGEYRDSYEEFVSILTDGNYEWSNYA